MAPAERRAEAILVVEDDPDARELAAEHLEAEGWPVRTASTGSAALDVVDHASIGLVVLDLGLPDLNGLDVLSQLRRRHRDLPVIILTAAGGEPNRVRGLWSGADDYVEKPCSPRELVARVRTVLRRSGVVVSEEMDAGGLTIDHGGRTVDVGGQPVVLTRAEFDVLARLAERPGQVLTRDQLVDSWSADGQASAATVTEIVRRVRTKLAAAAPDRSWIDTVRGVGYRFSEER